MAIELKLLSNNLVIALKSELDGVLFIEKSVTLYSHLSYLTYYGYL